MEHDIYELQEKYLDKTRQDKTRQDKTRQLYLTRVAQSAARLVSLAALGSIKLTYTHLQ